MTNLLHYVIDYDIRIFVNQREVSLMSDGLRLSGLLRVPAETGAGPRPGIIMLHGFGGTKDAPTHRHEAEAYAELGYVVLQVDFRGCGASEGARGRILCQDAVADAKNALTWFAAQPEVDPQRIAMTGQSYGAANDSVTPTTGSMELMRRAGPGARARPGLGKGFFSMNPGTDT